MEQFRSKQPKGGYMRVTIDAAPVETLEYLKTITMVIRNNKEVDDSVNAFKALRESVERLERRLDKLESGRNKVCR